MMQVITDYTLTFLIKAQTVFEATAFFSGIGTAVTGVLRNNMPDMDGLEAHQVLGTVFAISLILTFTSQAAERRARRADHRELTQTLNKLAAGLEDPKRACVMFDQLEKAGFTVSVVADERVVDLLTDEEHQDKEKKK